MTEAGRNVVHQQSRIGYNGRRAVSRLGGASANAARENLGKLDKISWRVLILCIAFLPLGFLPLTPMIGLPFLKPIHIAAFALLALLPALLPASAQATRIIKLVAAAYLFRLSVLFVSMAWSPAPADGALILVIDLINGIVAMTFCLAMSRLSVLRLADLLAYGALAGAAAFHLALFVGHALRGQSAIAALIEAALSGDPRQFKGDYFVVGMRGLGVEGVSSFFGTVAPKATNAFGNAFITPAIAAIHLTAADKLLNKRQSVTRNWVLWVVFINVIFTTLIAFSDRVQIYGLLLVLTHLFYFGILHGNRRIAFAFLYVAMLSLFGGLVYLAAGLAAQGSLEEYVTGFINNPRFTDLSRVLERLGAAGILGDGIGAQLGFGDVGYLYPHNLFLSDYLAAGMLGLVAAVIWIGRLAYLSVDALNCTISKRSPTALKRIALAAFTILSYSVILTQLTSQGSLDLADWMGLAIGLTMLTKAAELGSGLNRPTRQRQRR